MKKKPNVYIVDDDDAAAASVAALMDETVVGLHPVTFKSAESFLDTYDGTQEGCLVLDIRLTGMSGLDLYKTLREQGSDLPTILVSGRVDAQSCDKAVRDGVFACLEKPYSGQKLCQLVQSALSYESNHNCS